MTMASSALRSAAIATAAASGTFSAVGSLPTPAFWAAPTDSAVVLANGQVLVAGGEDGLRNPQTAVSLFDPAANTWSATGSLLWPRRLHSTTKLADGRVLVAGGVGGQDGSALYGNGAAEIYDPTAKTWSPTGSMMAQRYAHSATLLANGKVLVAGGLGFRDQHSTAAVGFAEIYDPATNQWTFGGNMTDARFGHPAVALHDGRVLVVGGGLTVGDGQYSSLGFCEIYDPTVGANGTWTPTGSLQWPRKSHQATTLADGTVLVTGGDDPGVLTDWTYSPYSQFGAERYNPATGTWTAATDMPWGRSHHRTVLLSSGKVLVIGGTDASTFDIGYQNATIFDPVAGSWTDTIGTVTGRWAFATAELTDGRVLAAGGIVLSGAATPTPGVSVLTATAEVFTP